MISTRKSASHGEAGYEVRKAGNYFTQPWVTQILCKYKGIRGKTIFEPACGDGRMSDVLSKMGNKVISNDLHNYGYVHQDSQFNFLRDPHPVNDYDMIVTNPPYDLIVEFICLSVGLTRKNGGSVCILARHEFDATHHSLWDYPYTTKIILPRRPKWIDGPEGDKASPRFPYAWYCWNWAANEYVEPLTIWLEDMGNSLPERSRK